MQQKKYWQNLGELKDSEAYQASLNDEFAEELPYEAGTGMAAATAPRRDFLKYLGFSTAAAMAAASCEMPVKKSIPYLNKPENFIPGVPDYYASTWVQDGLAVPVVVKVRDGRPIKIEGNELSSLTGGGTSAPVQASVLDLYDMARLRFPLGRCQGSHQLRSIRQDGSRSHGRTGKCKESAADGYHPFTDDAGRHL